MHQLPTYSRGLVPRYCEPATYIVRSSRMNIPTTAELIKAAHRAVNVTFDFTIYHKDKRHIIRLWESGPKCLYDKTRYRPLVIARALVVHYQRTVLNMPLKDCKRTFNVHHSSVIHMTEFMNGQLDPRFPNDVADAWQLFLKLIER